MTLLEAYSNTHYTSALGITLHVGQSNPMLNDLLKERSLETAAYITAWNPLSVEFSLEDNQQRNQQLLRDILTVVPKTQVIAGFGKDPSGKWLGEESFLILGIGLKSSEQLAEKYEQNAFVFYAVNGEAQLITTPRFKYK